MKDVLNEFPDGTGTCTRAVQNITEWTSYTNRILSDTSNSFIFDSQNLPSIPRV
jgi:hypothetical protein